MRRDDLAAALFLIGVIVAALGGLGVVPDWAGISGVVVAAVAYPFFVIP